MLLMMMNQNHSQEKSHNLSQRQILIIKELQTSLKKKEKEIYSTYYSNILQNYNFVFIFHLNNNLF